MGVPEQGAVIRRKPSNLGEGLVANSTLETSRSTFCSYCGRPPKGVWAQREHRVCRRCQLGIVLSTDGDSLLLALGRRPFMIVDNTFTVQAFSRLAEAALRMEESDVVGFRLDEILIAGADHDDLDLERELGPEEGREVPVGSTFSMRTVRDPESRFTAMVATCGPPEASLLVLEQVLADTDDETEQLERALLGPAWYREPRSSQRRAAKTAA
jgi:hypothetical protein